MDASNFVTGKRRNDVGGFGHAENLPVEIRAHLLDEKMLLWSGEADEEAAVFVNADEKHFFKITLQIE